MIPPRAAPPRRRQFKLSEFLTVGAIVGVFLLAVFNVMTNMTAAGINPGFDFLSKEAGFDVSESLIPYATGESYAYVILTGVINTLFLATVSLVLATLLGLAFGLISVGPSPVGRGLALAYVELFRNVPKLLILLILYVVAVNGLPHVRQAFSFGPLHISNRSLNFPLLLWDQRMWIPIAFGAISLLCWFFWKRWAVRRGLLTPSTVFAHPLTFAVLLPLISVFAFEVPVEISFPELKGFDFKGGARVSTQFVVIALTLGIYHGAQIAEVVRGGLQAIPKGQTEAAKALGLTRWQTIRLVVLPQVLRIVIPPMNNQYVNLIKNTSIAIAVGYSDLMSVSGTIINQTFKPLEMMLITMGIYLVICVSVTSSLNHFHHRLTARETR